jgi:Heterokaryon incompatibility protein (HET)
MRNLSSSITHHKRAVDPTEPYSYTKLDAAVPGSFRLVSLRAGEFGSPIVCDLTHDSYETQKSQYEALSYVWGDETIRKAIQIGGKQLHVTESLHIALQYLRYSDRSRLLWIDAVCINQGDLEERGQQVSCMGRIYENCRRVVVWLSKPNAEAVYSVSFLRELCNMLQEEGLDWFVRNCEPGRFRSWFLDQKRCSQLERN